MVREAVRSNGVEELFSKDKELKAGVLDLFDDEYLKKIDRIELPNTKVKILQQLLSQAIEDFKKVNKIKAVTFSERLSAIVDQYNSRPMSPDEINDILNDVADQLLNLFGDLKKEKKSFEGMGIDYEEKAFYDVLVATEEKYKFSYPEDKNIDLAKKIHTMVTEKTKYADWENRMDIKAELQADIIYILAMNGFPPIPKDSMSPENYQKIYNDVIDQTENFKKYYNA